MIIQKITGDEWVELYPEKRKNIWKDAIFHKFIDSENNIIGLRRLGKDKDGILTSYNFFIFPEFRGKAKKILDETTIFCLALGRFRISKPVKRIQELFEIKPKFSFIKEERFWEVIKLT